MGRNGMLIFIQFLESLNIIRPEVLFDRFQSLLYVLQSIKVLYCSPFVEATQ